MADHCGNDRCLEENNVQIAFIFPNRWKTLAERFGVCFEMGKKCSKMHTLYIPYNNRLLILPPHAAPFLALICLFFCCGWRHNNCCQQGRQHGSMSGLLHWMSMIPSLWSSTRNFTYRRHGRRHGCRCPFVRCDAFVGKTRLQS